jgi:interleukin-1 receptor-associated kinase 1
MNINAISDYVVRKLSGWSYNKGEPLLIYEYMTNGSLDQHIFRRVSTRKQQEDDTSLWQWHTRYSIARDIATGLHYVHHEHEPMVLHRDIKASNIMLDSAFRARLGDFGIACTVAVNRSSVTGVAGTFGYIGPDYAMRYKATRQTDIYAFGVLILEIVTGKKNGDVMPDDDHITDWVWRLHREGKLLEAAHGVLTVEEDYHQLGLDDDVVDEAKRLLAPAWVGVHEPQPIRSPEHGGGGAGAR